MSVVDDPKTFGRARLSFASEADIDEFVTTLERYERGELTPDEWRQFRLVRGTYGQRQSGDAQMLRVKIPQGVLTADQLEALADVAERYSRGFGHITTRQNVQFHFVKLHDAEPAMRRLADAGLTTREACGNSVRNITACLLHEFLPASEIVRVAEAVLRVFARFGDYEHKQRNRMKFLIRSLGWRRWREEYDRELSLCRLRGDVPTLEIDPPASEAKPGWTKESSPSVGHIASRVSAGRV